MELGDYATALNAARQLVPAWNAGDIQQAQLQGLRAQTQLQQQQATAQQQEQARAQALHDRLTGLGRNPTPEALYGVAAEFPEFGQHLNQTGQNLSAEQRTRQLTDAAQVYQGLAKPSGYAAVRSMAQRHIDAARNSGQEPDPMDAELVAAIDSGDADKIATYRGLAYAAANSLNPQTARNFNDQGDGGYTLSPGQRRFGANNTVIAEAPFAPREEANALEVPVFDTNGQRIGTQLIPNGGRGGGQVSGGAGGASPQSSPSAPAGRTQFGWTPRARNGGDNNDAAVDSKNAGMAQALGIGITTPFPAGMTNMQIAQALTLSEGGAGSLADRNNNPGNLRDSRTGGYRTFPTREAGLAAAAAQVARNRARGQNTIQTMVEGLPVGGAQSAAGGGRVIGPVPAAAGGVDNVGGYVPGTAVGGMTGPAIDAAAQRYNLTGRLPPGLGRKGNVQQAILSRAAQLNGGQDGGAILADQASRAADMTALTNLQKTSANILAFENTALRNGALALRTAAQVGNGGIPVFNAWVNGGRRATGDGAVSAFNAAISTFANEYARVTSGSNGVTSDTARAHAHELINSAQSPDQLIQVMRTLSVDMHNRRVGLEHERGEIMNRIRGDGVTPPRSGFRILSVRPK